MRSVQVTAIAMGNPSMLRPDDVDSYIVTIAEGIVREYWGNLVNDNDSAPYDQNEEGGASVPCYA